MIGRCRFIPRLDRRPHVDRHCRKTGADGLLLALRSRGESPPHLVDLADCEGCDGNAAAQLRNLPRLPDAALDVVDRYRRADFLIEGSAGSEGVAGEGNGLVSLDRDRSVTELAFGQLVDHPLLL